MNNNNQPLTPPQFTPPVNIATPPPKKFNKTILIGVGLIVIAGLAFFGIKYSKNSTYYLTYTECVSDTRLPCKHYFVDDLKQEWKPSPYKTQQECSEKEQIVGSTCVVPEGNFSDTRWINSVDLQRAESEQNGLKSGIGVGDWKTYTDPKYYFSFKYPTDFPFGTGRSVSNAYYTYQIPGPRGAGEVTAQMVVIPANKFRIDVQMDPVKISNLNQILPIYANNSYKSELFKTESGKNGVKIYYLNPKDISFFSAYYILDGAYVYEFNTWKADNDFTLSKIADTLDLSNAVDPVVGQTCGGGAMGNGGACPTGYSCELPPNHVLGSDDGKCAKN